MQDEAMSTVLQGGEQSRRAVVINSPEDQNGLREALARAKAEALERADVEAELMAGIPHNPAPPPIPVRGPYFLIECEHCGWVGSSEQGGTFCGDWGDSDVYCPVCDQTMRCDGPNEADTAKHGQAVFDRITAAETSLRAAEAEITRLKEGMEARTKALGAAISRREWSEVEAVHAMIRDAEFDRHNAGPSPIPEPWKHCPSTHCAGAEECRSPSDCTVRKGPQS